MANNPPSYKNIFLALKFFKTNPRIRAVRIGNDIVYKKEALRNLTKLTTSALRGYYNYRNDQNLLIDKLLEGYQNNDYNIFYLINSPQTAIDQPENQSPDLKGQEKQIQNNQEGEEKQEKKKPPEAFTFPAPSAPTPIIEQARATTQTVINSVPTAAINSNTQIFIKKATTKIFVALKNIFSLTSIKNALFDSSPNQAVDSYKSPSPVTIASSESQIFVKKLASKYLTPTRVATVFSGAVGAVAGFSIGGPIGALVGGAGGSMAPTFIQNGEGERILNMASLGSNTASNIAQIGSKLSFFTPTKVGIAIGIAVILILMGPTNLLETMSQFPPYQQSAAEAAISTSDNINLCLFTRGDQKPAAVSYKSPLLLSYFQNASDKTTVPATLLAAIARVESPGVTSFTDEQVADYTSSCAKSSTGALGIMQIQPPGTTGYIETAVAAGAAILGKTVAELTEADFCNPRSGTIMAAEFILNKLKVFYNLGDGKSWDPAWTNNQDIIYKVANIYYGCLEYGTSEKTASGTTKCAGPYNYGTDLWTSVQSCQQLITQESSLSLCPTSGIISTPYGINIYGYVKDASNEGCLANTSLCHSGVDISAPEGTPVKSSTSGIIAKAGQDEFKGYYITVDNTQGILTTYSHLKQIPSLKEGASIKIGQEIGLVGHTGSGVTGDHLHYQIKRNGTLINPLKYLKIIDGDPSLLVTQDSLNANNYQLAPPVLPEHNKDNWGECR